MRSGCRLIVVQTDQVYIQYVYKWHMMLCYTMLQIFLRPLLAPALVVLVRAHHCNLDDDEDEDEEAHARTIGGDNLTNRNVSKSSRLRG